MALLTMGRCGAWLAALPAIGAGLLAWHASAAVPAEAANHMGMGIGAPLDWAKDNTFADVVRTAREFGGAPVDRDGWPLSDFRLLVWADPRAMNGTYCLSFEGQADGVAGGNGVSGLRYTATTNTSTAKVQVNESGPSTLYLAFTGTRRTSGSPRGTGVTGIKLMRPVSPGSRECYPTTALFHSPLKTLVSKVQVVRFMDFLATNGNQQRVWSDRTLPSSASFSRHLPDDGWQGNGAPWEHVFRFANEVKRDAWINIPAKADDDYVRKVALTARYGSDGMNPYSSPQVSPVHPPLDPHLKLYVEYSNELWNSSGAFTQSRYNRERAIAEVAAGGSPLQFDGLKDPGGWSYAWRRVALRTVQISEIFRSVFGDAAMMTRIRPVLMTQAGNGQDTFHQAIRLLHGYFNNGEGSFVARPRPPGYYVYGAGGSGYYNPDNHSRSLTLDDIWSSQSMAIANWAPALRHDADRAAAIGAKRVAYEGGPSLDRTGASEAVKAQAWGDPRMKAAVIDHHDAWSASGGDLLVYYTAAHDYQWGFAQSVYDLATPKLQAIDELRARPRAPTTHGTPVPGTAEGNAFAFSSRGWDRPGSGRRDYSSGDANQRFVWASYTFRTSETQSVRVQLRASGASGARVAAYWDGTLLGSREVGRGTRVVITFEPIQVGSGPHGLIVRAVAGSFTLDDVQVQ